MRNALLAILLAGVAIGAGGIIADTSALAARGGGHGGGGHGGGHGGGGHGGFHGGGFHGGGLHAGGFRGGVHIGGIRAGGFRGGARGIGGVHGLSAHGFAHHGTGAGAAALGAATHVNRNAGNRNAASLSAAGGRDPGRLGRGGFRRNAFGDPRGWHHWGGQFGGGGYGWAGGWGGGWDGWAGPVFWPFLYGDMFSFALWPDGDGDPLWAFGPDYFLTSLFAPVPLVSGSPPDDVYYGATATQRSETVQQNQLAAQSCAGLAPGVTELPMARIRSAVQPDDTQSAALDRLAAATAKAADVLRASCPTAIPLTPVARLDAAVARLDAAIKAVDIFRDPLAAFYGALDDGQQRRFDAIGGGDKNAAPQSASDLATLCAPQSADLVKLPEQRIDQVIAPNSRQQEAFAALKSASESAAAQLQAGCPSALPATPVARLDTIKARLTAMAAAMTTVRPRLEAFYAALDDDQKARFNTLAPPRQAAAPQSEDRGR